MLCDNYHPGLHLGQFNFHLNASFSLTSINPWVFLNLCIWFLLTYTLCFSSTMYSVYAISICIMHLSRYRIMILLCEVVSLVIGIGQSIG